MHNCQSWLGVGATCFQWEEPGILLKYSPILRAAATTKSNPSMPVVPRLRKLGIKWYLIVSSIWRALWVSLCVFPYVVSYLDLLFCKLPIHVLCSFFFWLFMLLLSIYKNTLFVLFVENIIFQICFYWLVYSIFCQTVKSHWRT